MSMLIITKKCNLVSFETILTRTPCMDPEGDRGLEPPLENHIRVSWQYWSESHRESQSYKASIQCSAIFGPLARCHLNGVSLAGLSLLIN